MSLGVHAAYMWLGNFYDSNDASYGYDVNGSYTDVRPVNPWTAFIVITSYSIHYTKLYEIVHFSVYFLLPWLHNAKGLNMGEFTVFLEGTIRNPAIAASSAIIASLAAGLILYRNNFV